MVVRGASDGCWSEEHAPHAGSADIFFSSRRHRDGNSSLKKRKICINEK